MNIRILNADPLYDYRSFCKITVGEQLEEADMTPVKNEYEFWVKQCCAMHSTIRAVHFRITDTIPRSVAMQLVRHTDGHPQPEVQSSRPDWTGKPRETDPKALKLCAFDFTPESFIKMCRKRLCVRTEADTRHIVEGWVKQLKESDIPLLKAIGDCCVSNCEYLNGYCPEIKSCGKYPYLYTKYCK